LIRRCPRLCVFAYEYVVFLGRVTNPSAKPPFLEDQFFSLSLASLFRLGRPYQEHKFPAGLARKVIEARKPPPPTATTRARQSGEEEEIVDAPGNDGNASMGEQVKRPNPWRKMMMMNILLSGIHFLFNMI